MKKIINFFGVAIFTIMFFASCEINNQTIDSSVVIEATNIEIGDNDIDSVKAVITTLKLNSDGKSYWVYNEIVSAKFENGGFKLNFPITIPEEYLGSIREIFKIFSYEGITVSDMQAKTGWVVISGYNSVGEYVGDFLLRGNEWFVEFEYSDRSFTEQGNFKSGGEVDCSYNKGLNIIYNIYGGNTKSTTQKPLNEDFKWYLATYSIGIAD